MRRIVDAMHHITQLSEIVLFGDNYSKKEYNMCTRKPLLYTIFVLKVKRVFSKFPRLS